MAIAITNDPLAVNFCLQTVSKDQLNFTDSESRIMPTSGGGFEQAYNAQASVDMDRMLIVGNHVSQNPNDKQEVEPALTKLNQLPETLGQVERAALDSGFFSEENTKRLSEKEIEPYIACGRLSLSGRVTMRLDIALGGKRRELSNHEHDFSTAPKTGRRALWVFFRTHCFCPKEKYAIAGDEVITTFRRS